MTRMTGLVGLSLLALPLFAHHSIGGFFDTDSVLEVEGEVIEVRWRNPHVGFSVSVQNEAGRSERWEMQTTSLTNLRRRKLSADFLAPGDRVRIAGNPAKNVANGMYVSNVLLPSGEEVVLAPSTEPRWSERFVGTSQRGRPGDSSAPELGIYRVWSTPLGATPLRRSGYPLTAAAQASVAAFDPAVDSPTLNCAPKGMPTIMGQPYPMEIREQGDTIILQMEEYDTMRTIYMSADARPRDPAVPRLGVSTGRWEGQTLVVETFDASWSHFNMDGVPLSPSAEMVERFTVSEDGSRLDYQLAVTDPVNFTEPVTLEKYWAWYPEVVVEPYECIVD